VPPRSAGVAVPAVERAPATSALDRLSAPQRADATIALGAELFDRLACATCHRPGAPGMVLNALGARYAHADLVALLKAPPASMPAPALDDTDRAALAAYLRAAWP
jgi:mono/diheme cytochrome c family protein